MAARFSVVASPVVSSSLARNELADISQALNQFGRTKPVRMDIRPPTLPGVGTEAASAQAAAGGGDPKGMVQAETGDGEGAKFFGVQASGKRIAFVVDTSASMYKNGRYMRCREELGKSLSELKPNQKYLVVFFNSTVLPMPGKKLIEAKLGNLAETIGWLRGVDPKGVTDPVPGLKLSLAQNPDAIFLLTDGSFTEGTLEKILALQSTSKKVPIHTIAFESEDGKSVLNQISGSTGGTYRFVP